MKLATQIYNIITEDEASELRTWKLNKRSNDFSNPIINKVANKYMEVLNTNFELQHPSYWVVENKLIGHKWHYDGCKEVEGKLVDNHMSWCKYGSSILVSNPEDFEGGELWFKEGDYMEKVEDHYLSGAIYPAGKDMKPSLHLASYHKGKRKVLLMFFDLCQ